MILPEVEQAVADLGEALDQHDATEDEADRAVLAAMIADHVAWLGAVVGARPG